jgi:serine/threonine-protein kinase HipA
VTTGQDNCRRPVKLIVVDHNALIGNHDAHAKNFSLLYQGSRPTLAPLYDILSTAVYDHLTPKMAMKLGEKYKFTDVQARHWDQFAEGVGLSKAQTRRRVMRMAQVLPGVARRLQASPPFSNHSIVNRIVSLVEQRAGLIVRRMLQA